ncbi:MAG: hypothetical protein J0665_08765 [Deltaproteobacteria bacterium]|nr:hypothetical protein [Deltaproteobacteria bacterium]
MPLSHYLTNYENSGNGYNGKLYLGRLTTTLDSARIDNMLGKAVDLLNRKYDKAEIAKIALRIATGIGRYSKNEEYICSEFVEECFNTIGIAFQKKTGTCITPEDIADDPSLKPFFEVMPDSK